MKQYFFCCIALIAITIQISAQYNFSVEKSLQCTPVQDQQNTNTCWSFATTSFLESEMLRTGRPTVNLSEMYTVRKIYLDKARNYLLRQGKANFAEGGLSHDVIHATATYGVMPEFAYPGKLQAEDIHSHAELAIVLKSVLDGILAKHVVSEKWPDVINAILDVYLGPVPQNFTVGTQSFTPDTYMQSLQLNMEDYVSITSFTHHPFYQKFVLEIPDNHANGSYYNVPQEDFLRITRNAIEHGFTVAWDGDVSEGSFNTQLGIAVVPESEREDVFVRPGNEQLITQQGRQQQFENYSTTDDHLMHMTGLARDQNGTGYFLVKNSWGETGAYSGFLYMSESYFMAKTIAIMVHRDAIPDDISSRITF